MRRKVVAGNWKMNMTDPDAVELAKALKDSLKSIEDSELVLCPPFTSLSSLSRILAGGNIALGAQNLFWESAGAYTGEVSAEMLLSVGCKYVIIGHSERRQYFGEDNQSVNKKVKTAIQKGLTPIVCVGERLEQREAGKTEAVVEDHIRGALEGLSSEEVGKAIIAYEPVWAIGTGKTATPEQAGEVHLFIRELIKKLYDADLSCRTRILYGGSVKPENARSLIEQPELDGFLVGGASLKVESFAAIAKEVEGKRA
jgi:triosephosphate isomerase